MRDMEAARYNEQLRALSTLFLNLDAVSIAALAYRMIVDGKLDLWSGAWTIGNVVLTFSAVKILTLLRPED